MPSRLELHELLCGILGSRNAYFQPPIGTEINYPCIKYNISSRDSDYADDKPYIHRKRYTLTIIDKNPDSELPDAVLKLPYCSFDRHYTADNLNHDVYNLYF